MGSEEKKVFDHAVSTQSLRITSRVSVCIHILLLFFIPNSFNSFETNIPAKLSVDNVVHRDLSHKLNHRDEQFNLVDRYTQLYNR